MTILGVVSGAGGVGCSTLTAALGVRAAAGGWRVVVVDGDPLSGGLQVTLAAEHLPGHRWAHLVEVDGEVAGDRLLTRLPAVGGCSLLSGGRASADLEAVVPEPVPAEAFDAVIAALERESDLLVIDWGRTARPGWGATLLLVPITPRGLADTHVWLGRFGADGLAGIVTRGGKRDRRVAESVAAGFDLPLLGHLTPDRRVTAAERAGEPPAYRRGGSVRALADGLVASALAATPPQTHASRAAAESRR